MRHDPRNLEFAISLASPVGPLTLTAADQGLTHVLPAALGAPTRARGPERIVSYLEAAARALCEYFQGERTHFDDVVLAPSGSAFEQAVWKALREIPFGETRSYGALAAHLGRPGAARAVGRANGRNPISVLQPCHRVVGASGNLTGYAGGLAMKAWLLEHERRVRLSPRA
jgi:methylated-DNA-[protein]-cysteine S-methyltransferase